MRPSANRFGLRYRFGQLGEQVSALVRAMGMEFVSHAEIFGGSRNEPVVEPVFFGNTGTYNNENGGVVKSSFGV